MHLLHRKNRVNRLVRTRIEVPGPQDTELVVSFFNVEILHAFFARHAQETASIILRRRFEAPHKGEIAMAGVTKAHMGDPKHQEDATEVGVLFVSKNANVAKLVVTGCAFVAIGNSSGFNPEHNKGPEVTVDRWRRWG